MVLPLLPLSPLDIWTKLKGVGSGVGGGDGLGRGMWWGKNGGN